MITGGFILISKLNGRLNKKREIINLIFPLTSIRSQTVEGNS